MIEAIQLDNTRRARQDFQFESLCRSTPLGCADIAAIEGESLASTRRFPSQATFRKFALSGLLGEVEVDIIEALPEKNIRVMDKWQLLRRSLTFWRSFQDVQLRVSCMSCDYCAEITWMQRQRLNKG